MPGRLRCFLIALCHTGISPGTPLGSSMARFPYSSVLLRLVVFFAGGLLSSGNSAALDWPNYRGLNHDGSTTEVLPSDWTLHLPKPIWRVPLDPALSAFTVSGGRIFTQVRRTAAGSPREWCIALDAASGAELWAANLDRAVYPNGGVGDDDGPRSTPVVDGDRVYILTSYLKLHCLSAATGKTVWSRDCVAELGATVVPWENAAAPLLLDGLILLNGNATGGRLMAFQKADGRLAWRSQNDVMTQATPVVATLAGSRHAVFFTQSGLVSVDPATGALLWKYAFPFSTSTAASPVVAGDEVYCSAAYGKGAGMVQIQRNSTGTGFTATQMWRTAGANMNHWATPQVVDGFLYGIYGQSLVSLRCIEWSTGRERWAMPGVGMGGLIRVGENLLVLSEDGDLILVRPNPVAYTELARHSAVNGKCWNIPVLSNGRVYLRSTTEAACIEFAAPPTPLPTLRLSAQVLEDGTLQITASTPDRSPIDPVHRSKLQLLESVGLLPDSNSWTPVGIGPSSPSPDILVWVIDAPFPVGARWYQTVEQP